MDGTYIHSLRELPAGAEVLVYGAGSRGRKVLAAARRGKHVRVLGFVDSFTSGESCGLPVFALDALDEVMARPEMDGARILIASAFHRKIGQGLDARGRGGYQVFLDPDEGPPLVDVPVDDIARALNLHRNPLKATRRRGAGKRAGKGKCLRCASLSAVYFRPSGLSLCCWMPDLVEVPAPGGPASNEAALARLDAIRRRLADALDQGRNPFCATCPDVFETNHAALSERFALLHLDISTRCNLNCSYCIVKNSFRGVDYDFDGLCDHVQHSGLLAKGFCFDWGGAGEPTLFPGFEERTRGLLALGGSGLVYTNALKFSEVIAEGLRSGLRIVCSMDAGTRQTYANIRGVDGFETVWANIRRYLAAGRANVTLKYIVTRGNAAPEELRAFVARCAEEGVQAVWLSRDFYADTVTPAEEEALALLAGECARAGVGYSFLGTAVPERVAGRAPAVPVEA